ncbi:MAG: YbaY family lipoprotein [Rhodanobacteraceae bacterium]
MRKFPFPALLALALLGGCNSADHSVQSPQVAQPVQPMGHTINGTVSLRDPMQIGDGAKLDIKLVDIAQPEIPVAEKSQTVSGQPPYTFALDFDPSKIDSNRTYVVNVTLTDGPRHFVPALNSPVLTEGASNTAKVVLNAEATPGEKMDAEYDKVQAHIGGMKKIAGTYTTDTASIAWDAFVQGRKVVFMRVTIVEDKGGRTSIKYAFKDGKPLELVRKQDGVTTRVGWKEDGDVLVNHKSDASTVGDDELKTLYDDAVDALKRAQAKAASAK